MEETKTIWVTAPDHKLFAMTAKNTMMEHLDIRFEEIGPDYLITSMPVDHRTHQPMGLLHGGASAALSETNGSLASFLCVENPFTKKIVGIEINANHVKSVKEGRVYGKTYPIKLGKSLHVWQTDIRSEAGDLLCVSRLTVMVQ